MEITAVLLPRKSEERILEMAEGSTGMELLEKLNLPYDAHILTRDEVPIPLDGKLVDGDRIRIISVVSGG